MLMIQVGHQNHYHWVVSNGTLWASVGIMQLRRDRIKWCILTACACSANIHAPPPHTQTAICGCQLCTRFLLLSCTRPQSASMASKLPYSESCHTCTGAQIGQPGQVADRDAVCVLLLLLLVACCMLRYVLCSPCFLLAAMRDSPKQVCKPRLQQPLLNRLSLTPNAVPDPHLDA